MSCLFIHRTARRRGVGTALVAAAVAMAKAHGAPAVDAIPDARRAEEARVGRPLPGAPSIFAPLGFTEMQQRKPRRLIVRLTLR